MVLKPHQWETGESLQCYALWQISMHYNDNRSMTNSSRITSAFSYVQRSMRDTDSTSRETKWEALKRYVNNNT